MYMRMARWATQKGLRLWKITPKMHMVQELLLYQGMEWGNPSYFWCYADEDLVGDIVEYGHSCQMLTLCFTALVKWLVLCFDNDLDDE